MHRRALRGTVTVVLALVVVLATASAGVAKGGGGALPANARPHGYTLTEMAREVAAFTASGNDPALLPDTPFQVLYVDRSTVVGTPEDGGIVVTGSNSFTVEVGTPFYVPVFNVNDDPPVLGTFPTTDADAIPYFFDTSQVGAQGFEVIVDGKSTPLGQSYLAGPVTAEFAGDEFSVITLGVFLHPLPPGTHTVTIRGGAFGDLVFETYGLDFVREDFTYTVTVVTPS
jgi:hypothetical protein